MVVGSVKINSVISFKQFDLFAVSAADSSQVTTLLNKCAVFAFGYWFTSFSPPAQMGGTCLAVFDFPLQINYDTAVPRSWRSSYLAPHCPKNKISDWILHKWSPTWFFVVSALKVNVILIHVVILHDPKPLIVLMVRQNVILMRGNTVMQEAQHCVTWGKLSVLFSMFENVAQLLPHDGGRDNLSSSNHATQTNACVL